jgi:hypothetical protein
VSSALLPPPLLPLASPFPSPPLPSFSHLKPTEVFSEDRSSDIWKLGACYGVRRITRGGKERKIRERKGKEGKGKERKGKERKGKERKGEERTGKEGKGKERKGKGNARGKGKRKRMGKERRWKDMN